MRPLLTVILFAMFGLPANALADEPLTVIQQTVDRVIEVLKTRQDSAKLSATDRKAIHDIVDRHFDFREMSKRSMGSIWKKIDKQQRQQFVPVFQELLEQNYGNRLAGFTGQTVSYGEVQVEGKRAKVETEIDNKGTMIPVLYSLYNDGNNWLVYDINIEGVSLVATFRSDFRAIFDKDGFDGLLTQLNEKIATLKSEDASG